MNPPLPTRIAVPIILLCIAVLLASACGWGGGPAMPYIASENFVLWQIVSGAPDRPIGSGYIGGSPDRVFSNLSLLAPLCRRGSKDIRMSGDLFTLVPASALDLREQSNPVNSQPRRGQVVLAGTLPKTTHGLETHVLPFAGTLTLDSNCGNPTTLEVEARLTPIVTTFWSTGSGSSPGFSLELQKTQETQDTQGERIYEWGWLHAFNSNCSSDGILQSTPTPQRPPFYATFLIQDGSTVSALNLPTAYEQGKPQPITTTLKFAGGPCDGQTISITLKRF